jgi:hypothetical protein
LLYDLTSTYFECDAPEAESDPQRFGYSRDRRGDCVQVMVALVVTLDGLSLAYEMLPGNTADKTTLRAMLEIIERLYGNAERIWVIDRGIPMEAVLEQLRASEPRVAYLVGTPKGRLTKLEAALAGGLMLRVVFEKLAGLQMLGVSVPTTEWQELALVRQTEPEADVLLLLERLGLTLPAQAPLRLRASAAL